jgi:hypothetical protein
VIHVAKMSLRTFVSIELSMSKTRVKRKKATFSGGNRTTSTMPPHLGKRALRGDPTASPCWSIEFRDPHVCSLCVCGDGGRGTCTDHRKKPLRCGGRGSETLRRGLWTRADFLRGCEQPCPQPQEICYRRPTCPWAASAHLLDIRLIFARRRRQYYTMIRSADQTICTPYSDARTLAAGAAALSASCAS